jgi:hypothetical protein
MFPGLHPTAMMSTAGMNIGFQGNANGPPRPAQQPIHGGNNLHHNYHHQQQQQQQQHHHQPHQHQQQHHSNYNGIGGPNPAALAAVGIGGGVKPSGPPFGLAHHGGGVLGSPPMVAAAVAAAQCQVITCFPLKLFSNCQNIELNIFELIVTFATYAEYLACFYLFEVLELKIFKSNTE